jgi:hypothetical protein
MAQPIHFQIPSRNGHHVSNGHLHRQPEKYEAATLAGYDLLQALYDAGILEAARATVGGGSSIIEQAVAVASGPEAIRASRNLLLLIKALVDIDPTLLSDMTRAIPVALVQASRDEARPPGLIKLVSTFFVNKDFRRGLAAFNDLIICFGRNLTAKGECQTGSSESVV